MVRSVIAIIANRPGFRVTSRWPTKTGMRQTYHYVRNSTLFAEIAKRQWVKHRYGLWFHAAFCTL